MPHEHHEREEVARLAAKFRAIYEHLRPTLEAKFLGDHVVINVQTGDYVVGKMPDEAFTRAEQKFGSNEYCWSRRIDGR